MNKYDPPNLFNNGATLDANDVKENIGHWINMIQSVAAQRFIHSSVSLRYGEDNQTLVTEADAITKRTIRWYSPYEVFVEGAALFLNQSTAVTGVVQVRLSSVPEGMATSILIEASLAATTTTDLVQPFSKYQSFTLAKSTVYDFILEAQSSNTFDLRMADLQLLIKTDRWANDSSIPSVTQKKFNAASSLSATDINTVLASVESAVLTCNSNDKIPVPFAIDFRDYQTASSTVQTRAVVPLCGGGKIFGRGNTRITALQATAAVSASGATGATTVTLDLLGKANTVLLSADLNHTFASTSATQLATFAVTATPFSSGSADEISDSSDYYEVRSDVIESGTGAAYVHSGNFIIWEV